MSAELEAKSIHVTADVVVADFIREYFSFTEGRVWLSAIRNRNSKLRRGEFDKLMTRKPRAIAEFVSKHDDPKKDCAIYFCTATIKARATSRDADSCWEFPSLFADVDDKNHDLTRAEVIERLEALECKPTYIVDSGHGLQPHWLFAEPSEDAKRVIAARMKLHGLVASDSVSDAPRFMRLPGSHNSKEGGWLPVKIISHHKERRYALEVLEDWLDRADVVITAKPKAKTNGAANGTPFVLPPSKPGIGTDHRRGSAWARKALDESARELANAGGATSRHDTLRDKSIRMGTMITRGWIDIQEVKHALLAASEACGQFKEYGKGHFEQTFGDGIKFGLARPHPDLPDDTKHAPPIAEPNERVSDGDANGKDGSEPDDGRKQETPSAIHATPYVYKDPSKLPLRQYLYGKVLIRKFVSVIIGHTGIGKTTLEVAETLAQVSGKALLGIPVPKPLRVWLWNLEDPQDETDRKIGAGMLHYGLTAEDIGDRLFTDSGRDQPLVTAEMTRTGATIIRPVVDSLVDEMKRRQIDIIKIDPYVSSHAVPENDNGAQDMIVKEWGRVGDRTDSGVELSMHPRKSNGTEVTAEDARGASSTINGTRVKRALNRMTPAEANQAGVQNHRLYFRTLPDTSLAPPVEKSDWYKLVSVDLGNGPNGGDSVGVVTKWEWPDHLAGLTASDFEKVAAVIRRDKWRQHPKAKKWVGAAVAEAMELNADDKADKAKISAMLKLWLEAGSLIEVESLDENREMRKFIEVNEDA